MPPRDPIEFTNRQKERVGNEVQLSGINFNPLAVSNVPIQFGDSSSLDAFGRPRSSAPNPRFDAQFSYDLQPLLFEQITQGGGTVTHDATNRVALMTFAGVTNGLAYMQSYKWTFYHPGNSHQEYVSFNFRGHHPNAVKFAGYGDLVNNGIHFISDGTRLAWRILSDTQNGDQIAYQSQWNIDKLDGTGPSGYTLDITKTQITALDMQALYVGRVRVGFDIDGTTIYCHEFRHANRVSFPYIQSATLPVICGMSCIEEATTTMIFDCCTVRSEGAVTDEEGFGFSAEGTVTAASGARTHILSVRPNTTFNGITNRTTFVLESIELLVTGNNPVLWELCVGQAISGTTAFIDANAMYSAFEYNTLGTISGNPAIVAHSGYAAATAASKEAISKNFINRYPITLDAAGAVRSLGTLSVLVTGIGGTSATRVTSNWREIR